MFLYITNILTYPPVLHSKNNVQFIFYQLLGFSDIQHQWVSAMIQAEESHVCISPLPGHHCTQSTSSPSRQEDGPQSQPMGPNWQKSARQTTPSLPSQKKTKSWCRTQSSKRQIGFLVFAFSGLDHETCPIIQAWDKQRQLDAFGHRHPRIRLNSASM